MAGGGHLGWVIARRADGDVTETRRQVPGEGMDRDSQEPVLEPADAKVGGVEADAGERPLVTIDTTHMNAMVDLDPISRTATFRAGIYGPELEAALESRGFTLGHFPQSFEFSTLGGWIAARGAGQQSNRYGAADKWLVAARVVTPTGELRTLPFPHSAAGPDLNAVLAGSEGTLGIIVEATVAIRELAEASD